MIDPTSVFDRPIAFQRGFVSLGCGITGALLLSQAVYWARRTNDRDGWFYKTAAEWEEETGLTRREQETARIKLAELGVLHEVKRGVPCTLYYRVDFEAIFQLCGFSHSSLHKSAKLDCTKAPNKNGGKCQSSTEITTETTTENTTDNNGTSHDAPFDRTGNDCLQVPVVNSKLTPERPKKKTKLSQTIELIREKHPAGFLINIDENLLADWIKHKKYPTARVIAAMERELRYCADAGISPASAVEQQLERSWTGFKADWLIRERNQAAFNAKNNEPVEDWTEALRRGDYL